MAVNQPSGWLVREWRLLMGGDYPSFIYGSDTPRDDEGYLPIFTFHTLTPDDLEPKLRFLSENGYTTLTMENVLDHISGRSLAPRRSIALTIDDGRLSTWTVGLPLLRRFGMTATAFVVPGYLESGPLRPRIDDPAASGERAVVHEERDRRTFLRWSEVEALHESGIVQVESHSMLHKRVVTGRRLLGFLTPGYAGPPFDLPLPIGRRTGWTSEEVSQNLGAPIFEHDAVLGTPRALRPPPSLSAECVEHVRASGGPRYLRRRRWRKSLEAVVENHEGEFTEENTEEAQRHELDASKESLEHRLEGKRARHLCLPSGIGTEPTLALAREAGYTSVCWGADSGKRDVNRPGADPFRLERLKHDYIYRLPGRGRHGLGQILLAKARRRLAGRTGY